MAISADPDQLVSSTDLDLHCLQRHGISGFSRTRFKTMLCEGQVPAAWGNTSANSIDPDDPS